MLILHSASGVCPAAGTIYHYAQKYDRSAAARKAAAMTTPRIIRVFPRSFKPRRVRAETSCAAKRD